jgi:S-adenosyl methyltransferase
VDGGYRSRADSDGIASRLLDALPVGSYLALSHLTGDFDPRAWEGVAEVYAKNGMVMKVRSLPEIRRFFDGLDLAEPGVVLLPRWRPDPGDERGSPPSDAAVSVHGGLARKP